MSWVITGSEKTPVEALEYLRLVELADGQALEAGVRGAVISFVAGCKADGIWTAIKASCILAGARTLNGALVPLVGVSPTSFNFVAGDYSRKTGLVGNGSTKYLDSNRAGSADPQDSHHLAAFASAFSDGGAIISDREVVAGGSQSTIGTTGNGQYTFISRGGAGLNRSTANGLVGITRSGPSNWTARVSTTNYSETSASTGRSANTCKLYVRGDVQFFNASRLAFYSIGESLDLAKLDTRVTTLINALAAAIP